MDLGNCVRAVLRLVLALVLTSSLISLAPSSLADEPAEALCIIFIRPSQDFALLEIAADLILSPEQRANLSARVDANKDGTIDATEVDVYQNETRISYDGASIPPERRLRMDLEDAESLDLRTKLREWTGPRAEAEKGVVTEERFYRFEEHDQTGHTLEGALYVRPIPTGEPQVVVEVVVIDAPAGWRIARVAQTDGNGTVVNETFPSAQSYRISGFDLAHGSVTFVRSSTPATPTAPIVTSPATTPMHYDPAPGAALVVAMLAVAALVAARVRRR